MSKIIITSIDQINDYITNKGIPVNALTEEQKIAIVRSDSSYDVKIAPPVKVEVTMYNNFPCVKLTGGFKPVMIGFGKVKKLLDNADVITRAIAEYEASNGEAKEE